MTKKQRRFRRKRLPCRCCYPMGWPPRRTVEARAMRYEARAE